MKLLKKIFPGFKKIKKARNSKVINLFAGPGVGKSTTASGLFFELKQSHISCEVAPEFAKELVWDERQNMFPRQDYLFAEQRYRIDRLIGKVDWIITDSPLMLSHAYLPDGWPDSFNQFVLDMFNTYNNVNVYLERVKPYDPNGRNQDFKGSELIHKKIKSILDLNQIPYMTVAADRNAPVSILKYLDLAPKVT